MAKHQMTQVKQPTKLGVNKRHILSDFPHINAPISSINCITMLYTRVYDICRKEVEWSIPKVIHVYTHCSPCTCYSMHDLPYACIFYWLCYITHYVFDFYIYIRRLWIRACIIQRSTNSDKNSRRYKINSIKGFDER